LRSTSGGGSALPQQAPFSAPHDPLLAGNSAGAAAAELFGDGVAGLAVSPGSSSAGGAGSGVCDRATVPVSLIRTMPYRASSLAWTVAAIMASVTPAAATRRQQFVFRRFTNSLLIAVQLFQYEACSF
jgi:hypothetical protein